MDSSCKLFDFVTCTVVLGTLCVFGLIGNGSAILVLKKHPTETATINILLVLTVADSWLLVSTLLMYTAPSIYPFTGYLHGLYSFASMTKPYVWPLAMIAHTCTVWLTVMVTATRYISVCRLTKNTSNRLYHDVRVQVALVVVCSIIYNIPRFFEHFPILISSSAGVKDDVGEYSVVNITSNITILQEKATTKNLGDDRLYQIIYSNIIYFPVMFIIPLLSLSYMNFRLIQTIGAMKRKRESMTGHKVREDHITLCIIAIVCMFVVCQTPALVNQIFWAIAVPSCGSFHFYYTKISDSLVVLNSSCNFIIYCLFGQSFRKIFLQTICGKSADAGRSVVTTCRGDVPLINGVCEVCKQDFKCDASNGNMSQAAAKSCSCKRSDSRNIAEQATSVTAALLSQQARSTENVTLDNGNGDNGTNGHLLSVDCKVSVL